MLKIQGRTPESGFEKHSWGIRSPIELRSGGARNCSKKKTKIQTKIQKKNDRKEFLYNKNKYDGKSLPVVFPRNNKNVKN